MVDFVVQSQQWERVGWPANQLGSEKQIGEKGKSSTSASASGCNWDCYLGRYADLKKELGPDKKRAAFHYKEHGEKEGRNCN